jgi:hypothetical protein
MRFLRRLDNGIKREAMVIAPGWALGWAVFWTVLGVAFVATNLLYGQFGAVSVLLIVLWVAVAARYWRRVYWSRRHAALRKKHGV